MSSSDNVIDTILLNRGQLKFELGDFSKALRDFQRVSTSELNGRKHNNIGMCYYKLGIYDESEKEYLIAIRTDARLAEAYYNLAVLYKAESKLDRARVLLQNCLRINRNFLAARIALRKLQIEDQVDWYQWWFIDRSKKVLGLALLVAVFALVGLFGYLAFNGIEIASLAAPIGLLVLILLLPNLRKVKISSLEMEVVPFRVSISPLEPLLPSLPRHLQ